jgi:hypothetical protein
MLPEDTVPIYIMDTEEGWRMSGQLLIMKKAIRRTTPASFMKYLMTQEEHISQHYTQIEFDIVPIKLYELLKSPNKVLIATDGGAIPLKGLLEFIVADEEGTILAKCYGQPSGNDPLSFRSEICAFLAAARFITYLVKYYDS